MTLLVDIPRRIEQLVNDDPAFYNDIRGDLISLPDAWEFSLQHVESVKSMQDNLNALALIATFIAAVQAQVITYAIQRNSSKLEVAINSFFFTGLFLDILGGCIAHTAAVQLQHIYSILLRRKNSLSQITNALEQYTSAEMPSSRIVVDLSSLCLHLRFLEVIFLHALTNTSAWERVLFKVQESRRSLDDIIRLLDKRLHARVYIYLQEYQQTTNELERSRSGVGITISTIVILRRIVFTGVMCCIVGGLCYVKDAQPTGVWITSFAVVGGIFILFGVLTLQATLRS